MRIGHGYDIHRLQHGGRLMLAGVAVSEELSAIAHSDGDVVLHALVDALLGAMGWGDIGQRFANTDPRWRGAPSRLFVESVMKDITAAGYVVANADTTILAERPRLSGYREAMQASLASLLGVSVEQVNVKAGTNEGCDAVGQGQAIAAHALVLLRPV